jgi:acyl-coenzyme A synthetase/AMP-(fatty) acid ligase
MDCSILQIYWHTEIFSMIGIRAVNKQKRTDKGVPASSGIFLYPQRTLTIMFYG